MHATIDLNNQLLGQARLITGMTEPAALLHAGLDALIQRESAGRFTHPAPKMAPPSDNEAHSANDHPIVSTAHGQIEAMPPAPFNEYLTDDPAERKRQAARALAVMNELQGKLHIGRKLTRDEMNER